jgi:multicomponent Na+:H+ antiporter subunit G
MLNDILSDILVVTGLLFMTLGIVGMIRMPDIYTKMHAASKSVFLGVISLSVAAMLISDATMIMRLVLLSVLVLITTPVSSHAIGRGAFLHHERMVTPGAVDESDSHLVSEESHVPSWRL